MAGFQKILSRIRQAKAGRYDAVADALAREGEKIVDEAMRSAEVTYRSGNMADAFGYAVFHNGKEVRRGYANNAPTAAEAHKGWAKHGIPADTGRGYLDTYFDSYIAPASGFHLVVVNAIYYTRILEAGAQARPKRRLATRYRIISQIADDMDRLASKYRAELTGINM